MGVAVPDVHIREKVMRNELFFIVVRKSTNYDVIVANLAI